MPSSGASATDQYAIVADICTFMPEKRALVVIDGLGDPRVLETLKKVQEARANPTPDPYRPSTTQPTSQPTTRPATP